MRNFWTWFARVLLIVGLSLPAFAAARAEEPKTLNIAAVLPSGVENAWTRAWLDSFEKIQKAAPDGLKITLKYTENVYADTAASVIRGYAETGKYDVIWAHSSYSDEVEALKDEFPNILFVTVGGGNRPLGGNSYLIYMHIHEPAYVAGVFAGLTSKSKVLGAVGLFPADDVNDVVNAFRAGARSVAPDSKVKVTFIESWYDPAKASEAANAQISAGADIIFQLGESFQVCQERKIMCIGQYIDSAKIAPSAVPLSVLVNWEPQINYIIDQWKKHKETGEPYNAPMEPVWFTMAQGGSGLSGYGEFADKIPDDVKQAVKKAQDDILSGATKVELKTDLPVSD
ncbi:BMP family protein [Mesorhizobium sp. SP-1A]|uniref:BMP family lipoprotein n=1 Tax=Mesorhizobium sp. SP-1A TaxID=3077840 RepID=UPI0028F72DE7|nr:BMP family protein [Mesorhizobium sp. SP-1A]